MTRLINAKLTEEIIQLAVSYCQDGQHPDDLEKDLRNLITNAQTIEAEMFPSEGLQKALENYKKPSPLPVCKLTHEQLNTPYGVEPIKQTIEADSGEAVAHLWESIGRWSAYLVSNGSEANLAPPDWLLDAVKKATSPQKQWVELTDEQIKKIINDDASWTGLANPARVAKAIQSKLKEVNHG